MLDYFKRENLVFIPLEHVRGDLRLGKLTHLLPKRNLVFVKREVHRIVG
jgi:hypothetical protein